MIHQFIFASPKPGMSEAAFHDYWVNIHAVNFASKIKQIRKYIVDTRVDTPWDQGEPVFGGIAEIWIRPEDQLPSLQSPEFLEGARLDEPRWAAFWKTLVLDTNAHEIIAGAEKPANGGWIKSVTLLKRKSGMPLQAFRDYAMKIHAPRVAETQAGLTRYLHCQTVDGYYGLGEARYDAIDVCCYESVDALVESAGRSRFYAREAMEGMANFVDLGYLFQMYVAEHWIIGPEARA
jgi:hypothetical protein